MKRFTIDKSWLQQLLLLVTSLAMSFYYTYETILVFLITCAYYLVTKNTHRPFYIIGVSLYAYLLLGGSNISLYRGTIESETLLLIFFTVLSVQLGGFLAEPLVLNKYLLTKRVYKYNASTPSLVLVVLSLAPSVIASLWLIIDKGIPALNPSSRFELSPWVLILIETSLVSAMLIVQRMLAGHKSMINIVILVLCVIILIIPAYRGWLVIAVGITALSFYMAGHFKLSFSKIVGGLLILMIFFGGMDIVRRTSSDVLLPPQVVKANYSAEKIPYAIAVIHFSLRETIALTQKLLEKKDEIVLDNSIFFSDILTILPGKQQSGGYMVSELVGGRLQKGGLTPGASGILFLEFGWYGLFFMVIIGYSLGVIWKQSLSHPNRETYIILFSCCFMYFLHYFHRGIPKISYIIVPLTFLFLSLYGDAILKVFSGKMSVTKA